MGEAILHLAGSFQSGGSERQAVGLAARLKAEGSFDVRLAVLSGDGPLRLEAEAAGFDEIPEFPLTSFYSAGFVRQAAALARYLRQKNIRLIHTHDFYTNVFGMAGAALAGVEARIASKRETTGMRSKGQEFVEGIALRSAHAVVANSAAVAEHLKSRGVAASKLCLIYNGVDGSRFEDDEVPTLSEPSKTVITLVANLRHDVKNVPMLLRAARHIIDRGTTARFIIAGEGRLEDDLRRQIDDLGLDGTVELPGACRDVPRLLAGSDICVLTSRAEGFSNSILEYMAAGKAVVATNVGGAAEAVVEGETGYLIPSDDDAALAERLTELIEDKEKRLAFGANGRRIARERFSVERQIAATLELYGNCLARGHAAAPAASRA